MKRNQHIPVLILAAFFTVISNGIPVYEHFCKTAKLAKVGFFKDPSCNMEKETAPCCSKKTAIRHIKTKDCCEHKSFVKKFSFDGFTAKIFSISLEDFVNFVSQNFSIEVHLPFLEKFFTGLSPPDNEDEIAQYRQPTQPGLQVFIC